LFCNVLPGSFLPKNPAMADFLILTMLQRRLPGLAELPPLDDVLENNARNYLETCK